jgi:hypothetical protein
VSILHHLQLGIDHILVLDNGSTDATPVILRRLERRVPITVIRDDGPFRQAALLTGLVEEATRMGADWVVPFDDDEFLVSDLPFRGRLEIVKTDGVLIRVINFVQRRRARRDTPRALLTMLARPAEPVDAGQAVALGRSGKIAVVEAEWPRKLILRAVPGARLHDGMHGADGLRELEVADWLRFLHAPLRSPHALARSAEQGRRLRDRQSPDSGWQHLMTAEAEDAGRLGELWRLNSWDGKLAVGPAESPLVRDSALADTVRPWVRSRPAQLAARLARRSF